MQQQQQTNQMNGGPPSASAGAPGEGGVSSPAATGATGTATNKSRVNGGRFDFDDGGTYCGGWEDGKAHGHGVCTGPKGQGAYSGSWHYGFEVSGVYTWPSGSAFEGQWQNGKRHGLGMEMRGRWLYRGEWTQGFKGRYGVRQSNTSQAKYEGTWAIGLQDGYGSETYADEGTYQGQWQKGMRHGYGVRSSAAFGKASKYRNKTIRASLTSLRSNEGANADPAEKRDRKVDDSRGGFVLKMNSDEPARRRSMGEKALKKGLFGFRLKKQVSAGDLEKGNGSIRSTGSTASWMSTDSAQSAMTNASFHTDSNASFVVEDEHMDPSVTETYMGEWKLDKRTGFGLSERSDGLKYEGEWFANKKYGYGITTFPNGEKEEGKYKNNVLISSNKKRQLFLMRSAKFRERIDAAVNAAQRASKIALQKADIAISRTATARGKAEQADVSSAHARQDSDVAQSVAVEYAPEFKQPGLEKLKARYKDKYSDANYNHIDLSLPTHLPNQDHSARINSQIHNQLSDEIVSKIEDVKLQLSNQLHNANSAANPAIPLTKRNSILHNDSYYANYNKPSMSTYYQQNQLSENSDVQYNPHANSNSINNHTKLMNNNVDSVPVRNSVSREEPPQPPAPSLRRMSRRVSGDRPPHIGAIQQTSIDYFDHYKRPPSRDSSVDRYTRATGRLSASGSRQPSVDLNVSLPPETPERRSSRAPSVTRVTTPVPMPSRNGAVPTGNSVQIGNSIRHSVSRQGSATPQAPFEDIIIRKRGLGQDIIPSQNQPKRTESLYINKGPAPVIKNLVEQTALQRKKSLPDVQVLPRSTEAMSREEVSALGSARREEVRRMADERDRLRANPLLYLVSPPVKDWFARQQLVIVILFINISLAIMFIKLLT